MNPKESRKLKLAQKLISKGIVDPMWKAEELCEQYTYDDLKLELECYEVRREAVSFDY
jgi:hypothetical protein